MGALLCLAAGLLTYVAIERADRPPTTRFAVATRDLAPGEVLRTADVATVTLELPSALRARAVEGSADVLDGVTVLGPVAKGELLQRGLLVRRAAPVPTFSFPIQAEYALAGRVRPGTRVDLYSTEGNRTDRVAERLLVVRADGDTRDGTLVLTVALDADVNPAAVVAAAARTRLAVVETSGESVAASARTPSSTNPAVASEHAGS